MDSATNYDTLATTIGNLSPFQRYVRYCMCLFLLVLLALQPCHAAGDVDGNGEEKYSEEQGERLNAIQENDSERRIQCVSGCKSPFIKEVQDNLGKATIGNQYNMLYFLALFDSQLKQLNSREEVSRNFLLEERLSLLLPIVDASPRLMEVVLNATKQCYPNQYPLMQEGVFLYRFMNTSSVMSIKEATRILEICENRGLMNQDDVAALSSAAFTLLLDCLKQLNSKKKENRESFLGACSRLLPYIIGCCPEKTVAFLNAMKRCNLSQYSILQEGVFLNHFMEIRHVMSVQKSIQIVEKPADYAVFNKPVLGSAALTLWLDKLKQLNCENEGSRGSFLGECLRLLPYMVDYFPEEITMLLNATKRCYPRKYPLVQEGVFVYQFMKKASSNSDPIKREFNRTALALFAGSVVELNPNNEISQNTFLNTCQDLLPLILDNPLLEQTAILLDVVKQSYPHKYRMVQVGVFLYQLDKILKERTTIVSIIKHCVPCLYLADKKRTKAKIDAILRGIFEYDSHQRIVRLLQEFSSSKQKLLKEALTRISKKAEEDFKDSQSSINKKYKAALILLKTQIFEKQRAYSLKAWRELEAYSALCTLQNMNLSDDGLTQQAVLKIWAQVDAVLVGLSIDVINQVRHPNNPQEKKGEEELKIVLGLSLPGCLSLNISSEKKRLMTWIKARQGMRREDFLKALDSKNYAKIYRIARFLRGVSDGFTNNNKANAILKLVQWIRTDCPSTMQSLNASIKYLASFEIEYFLEQAKKNNDYLTLDQQTFLEQYLKQYKDNFPANWDPSKINNDLCLKSIDATIQAAMSEEEKMEAVLSQLNLLERKEPSNKELIDTYRYNLYLSRLSRSLGLIAGTEASVLEKLRILLGIEDISNKKDHYLSLFRKQSTQKKTVEDKQLAYGLVLLCGFPNDLVRSVVDELPNEIVCEIGRSFFIKLRERDSNKEMFYKKQLIAWMKYANMYLLCDNVFLVTDGKTQKRNNTFVKVVEVVSSYDGEAKELKKIVMDYLKQNKSDNDNMRICYNMLMASEIDFKGLMIKLPMFIWLVLIPLCIIKDILKEISTRSCPPKKL